MDRNSKTALQAGVELAERAHALQDAQALELLSEARDLFRNYQAQHEAKAKNCRASNGLVMVQIEREQLAKARVNQDIADRIQTYLEANK